MSAQELKKHLHRGQVYRRRDLEPYSACIDRDLKRLTEEGYLSRLQHGLYYQPKKSKFGDVPPEVGKVVEKFLKTDHFVMFSYSDFNRLGLGLTQLYNEIVVYNHKRHGRFKLAGLPFYFKRMPEFPKQVTLEFLTVAFLNEKDNLAEVPKRFEAQLQRTVAPLNQKRLKKFAKTFGKVATQKLVAQYS